MQKYAIVTTQYMFWNITNTHMKSFLEVCILSTFVCILHVKITTNVQEDTNIYTQFPNLTIYDINNLQRN